MVSWQLKDLFGMGISSSQVDQDTTDREPRTTTDIQPQNMASKNSKLSNPKRKRAPSPETQPAKPGKRIRKKSAQASTDQGGYLEGDVVDGDASASPPATKTFSARKTEQGLRPANGGPKAGQPLKRREADQHVGTSHATTHELSDTSGLVPDHSQETAAAPTSPPRKRKRARAKSTQAKSDERIVDSDAETGDDTKKADPTAKQPEPTKDPKPTKNAKKNKSKSKGSTHTAPIVAADSVVSKASDDSSENEIAKKAKKRKARRKLMCPSTGCQKGYDRMNRLVKHIKNEHAETAKTLLDSDIDIVKPGVPDTVGVTRFEMSSEDSDQDDAAQEESAMQDEDDVATPALSQKGKSAIAIDDTSAEVVTQPDETPGKLKPSSSVRKRGLWTSAEVAGAEKVFEEIREAEEITAEDLKKRIYDWTDVQAFNDAMREEFPLRSQRSRRDFSQRHFFPGHRGEWTPDQDAILRDASKMTPGKWTDAAKLLDRPASDCANRYKNVVELAKTRKVGPWSQDEVARLKDATDSCIQVLLANDDLPDDVCADPIKLGGYISWEAVSRAMGDTREPKRCREKYERIKQAARSGPAKSRDLAGPSKPKAAAPKEEPPFSNSFLLQARKDLETYNDHQLYECMVELVESTKDFKAEDEKTHHIWFETDRHSKYSGAHRCVVFYHLLERYEDVPEVRMMSTDVRTARALARQLKKTIEEGGKDTETEARAAEKAERSHVASAGTSTVPAEEGDDTQSESAEELDSTQSESGDNGGSDVSDRARDGAGDDAGDHDESLSSPDSSDDDESESSSPDESAIEVIMRDRKANKLSKK